ncbi:MAG: hypothetical protein JWQ50_6789 [Caballeronia mineralivorans]|jgi:hypothetical protein|nr:hypothetical protein [Caballeronia mineralivorans]
MGVFYKYLRLRDYLQALFSWPLPFVFIYGKSLGKAAIPLRGAISLVCKSEAWRRPFNASPAKRLRGQAGDAKVCVRNVLDHHAYRGKRGIKNTRQRTGYRRRAILIRVLKRADELTRLYKFVMRNKCWRKK